MKRVLFVDDEPQILDGLRNALRRQRSQWEMEFASSGAAALELLALKPADVVVSDMRMPAMDGAMLLTHIRERFPATARIVLTGQASKDDLLRVLPVAQQILSKPCEPQTLCATIERVCKVQALLANAQLQALVGGLDRLPSFPLSYQQLADAAQRDDVSEADITRIVERDPALSVKALSIANAAYFGLSRPTTSIQVAVRQLGFALLRALALTTDIFGRIDAGLLESSALRALPQRAVLRAQLARSFVTDRKLADEAFTAGLLLDIGMIVLAQRQPVEYLRILAAVENGDGVLHELEQARLGFTHADVGAYLLGLWGLPVDLVEIVAAHHVPALIELATNPVATAVHVADVFSDAAQRDGEDPAAGIAAPIRARPDIASRLDEWLDKAREAVRSE